MRGLNEYRVVYIRSVRNDVLGGRYDTPRKRERFWGRTKKNGSFLYTFMVRSIRFEP